MRNFLDFLVMAALAVMIAVLLLEFSVGCGEHYVDANGVSHVNECIFVGDAR